MIFSFQLSSTLFVCNISLQSYLTVLDMYSGCIPCFINLYKSRKRGNREHTKDSTIVIALIGTVMLIVQVLKVVLGPENAPKLT